MRPAGPALPSPRPTPRHRRRATCAPTAAAPPRPGSTYDAVLTGFLICGHRWDQDAHGPDDARLTWDNRVNILIPPGTEDTTFSTSRLFAATYPEAVKLAALIGSLHWRRLAADGPDGHRRFATEIGHRHGSNTAPKPNQHSIERNRRSATWFAHNRRGGRVILYHRHIGPVLIRGWSIPMDLFTGTVHASADTRTPRNAAGDTTANDADTVLTADYLRPSPAPSNYLATACTPVPWSTRITDQQPSGGRPWHAAERRLIGRAERAAAITRSASRKHRAVT